MLLWPGTVPALVGCAVAVILLQALLLFQVSTVRMQGVILLVFAKYYHLPFLQDIQTDCTRTGLGGYWVSVVVGGWRGLPSSGLTASNCGRATKEG